MHMKLLFTKPPPMHNANANAEHSDADYAKNGNSKTPFIECREPNMLRRPLLSSLHPKAKPRIDHPRNHQQNGRHHQRTPREKLRAQKPARVLQDGAGRRRADQQPQRAEAKAHAHTGADGAEVGGEPDEGDGGQANEAAGEEAIQQRKDDVSRRGVDADPGEGEGSGGEAGGDEDVERAGGVGDEVGEDAARDGGGVEDGQEVEGEVDWDGVVEGGGLHVEDGAVEADEADGEGDAEEEVGGFAEGGEVEEGAAFLGEDARFHDQDGDEACG